MSKSQNDIEKRKFKRMRLKFQIEIETLSDHKLLSLISRDISAGGLGISRLAPEGMEIYTQEELLADTKVAIRLILPGCDDEINLTGNVKWSERSKSGIWKTGIEFNEPQLELKKHYIIEEEIGQGRRSLKRYSHLFKIQIRRQNEKQFNVGLSANLSNLGMQLFSDILYSTDTLVEIKIPVFGTKEEIKAQGRVQWARQEGQNTWRIGIKFDRPVNMGELKDI